MASLIGQAASVSLGSLNGAGLVTMSLHGCSVNQGQLDPKATAMPLSALGPHITAVLNEVIRQVCYYHYLPRASRIVRMRR